MKCFLLSFLFSIVFGQITYHGRFAGDAWQNKTAVEKQQSLWNRVLENSQSDEFSAGKLAELFLESMEPSFDTFRDDLTGMTGPFGYFNRTKVVHTVGAIALCQFHSLNNHPYTGIFTGSKYAIIRLSTPVAYDNTDTTSFVPAAAFKFLRNGVPSANVMALGSFEGRDTYNPFKHDIYSNPIYPSLNETFAETLLQDKFMEATDWLMIGLSYIASFDESGQKINEPKFPYNLLFQGTKEVQSLYTDDFFSDYFPIVLARIPENMVIYNVWAQEPNKDPLQIGTIQLTTPFKSSTFGDEGIFFQHSRKEEDFKIRPDWISYATTISNQQAYTYYFNGPPDLPLH